MLLIEGFNLKKYYGDRLIIDVENIKIYSEDRIGIVGLNGIGKTTFINLLCRKLEAEEGIVKTYGTISCIPQLENSELKTLDKELASKFKIEDSLKDYMSGGEKTKFKLAKSLEENSQIIFADEPTSNLDMEAVKLLEKKFTEYKGALVIISHDREFLDVLCNKILELENGTIKFYAGNYTSYKQQKKMEQERAQFEYERYEKEKKNLEEAMYETKEKAKGMKKAPSRMGNSEARLHKMGNQKAKASLDSAVRNIKARLKHLEVKEKPKAMDKIKLDALSTDRVYSRVLISGTNINKAFGNKVIFKDAEFNLYNGSKVALIGPNGSGKSTLINMIINRDESLIISQGAKVGYFSQSLDILEEDLSVIENVMKESVYDETFARTFLARLLFKREDVYKRVKMLSGGERVKASLAKIFLKEINLLILDEPTNYLDIYSMEALEEALKEYSRTILFVSHDRRFVESIADNIISIENQKLISFNGAYNEYANKKTNCLEAYEEEKLKRIMVLENKLSELIGRLSVKNKKDDLEKLDMEYKDVLAELKKLKN